MDVFADSRERHETTIRLLDKMKEVLESIIKSTLPGVINGHTIRCTTHYYFDAPLGAHLNMYLDAVRSQASNISVAMTVHIPSTLMFCDFSEEATELKYFAESITPDINTFMLKFLQTIVEAEPDITPVFKRGDITS